LGGADSWAPKESFPAIYVEAAGRLIETRLLGFEVFLRLNLRIAPLPSYNLTLLSTAGRQLRFTVL